MTIATVRLVSAASKGVWREELAGHQTSAAAALMPAAGMASAANARGQAKGAAGIAASPTRNDSGPRLATRLQMAPSLVMRRMAQLRRKRPRWNKKRGRRSESCRRRRARGRGRRGELQSRVAAAKVKRTGRRRGGATAPAARRRLPPLPPARRPLTRRHRRPLRARHVKRNGGRANARITQD